MGEDGPYFVISGNKTPSVTPAMKIIRLSLQSQESTLGLFINQTLLIRKKGQIIKICYVDVSEP